MIAEADVLDEASWFEKPWRDARNVVKLLETLNLLAGGERLPAALHSALAKTPNDASAADYAAVDAIAVESTLYVGSDGVVIPAAASCLANWFAKSDGGGHVPNVFLRGVTSWLIWRGLDVDRVRSEIGRARARDLGLHDAAGAAEFMRLWRTRRYRAAWAFAASC